MNNSTFWNKSAYKTQAKDKKMKKTLYEFVLEQMHVGTFKSYYMIRLPQPV
jgi:hypothetical protein